jgi:TorA maturation chaperone TorD
LTYDYQPKSEELDEFKSAFSEQMFAELHKLADQNLPQKTILHSLDNARIMATSGRIDEENQRVFIKIAVEFSTTETWVSYYTEDEERHSGPITVYERISADSLAMESFKEEDIENMPDVKFIEWGRYYHVWVFESPIFSLDGPLNVVPEPQLTWTLTM